MRRLVLAALLALPVTARADVFDDRRQVFEGRITITHFTGCAGDVFCLVGRVEQGIRWDTGLPGFRGYLLDVSNDRRFLPFVSAEVYDLYDNFLYGLGRDAPVASVPETTRDQAGDGRRRFRFSGAFDGFGDDDPYGAAAFAAHGSIPLDAVLVTAFGRYCPDQLTEDVVAFRPSFTTVAPEPATWALLGTGLVAVGAVAWRRRPA